MSSIHSHKNCMIIAKKIIADILSSEVSKEETGSPENLAESLYLELEEHWGEKEIQEALSYIRMGVVSAILSLSSEEPTGRKVQLVVAVSDSIWKRYGPGTRKFPNLIYPSEEHRMKENRLNIDLFVPGEVSKSSWMALSIPSYFRPLGVYIVEGLAPTWTGFVNNRSSRTMAAMLIERRKELRVEMTKYFIKNHRFDSVIARAVQTSELPTPFGLGEFTYLDLFSKFLRDIPKIFSEEIEAIENFLKAISPLDYSGMEETVVVKLVSLINYLRELRSTLRVKLKSFTEFKESLSYYPRGIYGIQFFAEDVASLRPRNHVVSDILEMIKLHSEVDAERVIEDRSQCQYDLVADAFIQFLRDYRKARVPSFLSEAIPDEFARF